MVDFSNTRVWDVHAHPFLDRGPVSPDEFARLLSFGNMDAEQYFADAGVDLSSELTTEIHQWKRQTTWHKLLLRELAEHFGCERSLNAVVDTRNRAIAN